MVYGCDICQDVCPWNRGIEKRRRGVGPREEAEPTVSLVEWLEADGEELVRRYDRLYVPKNDPRYLRRNALVALGNVGRPEHAGLGGALRRGRRPARPRARGVGAPPARRSGERELRAAPAGRALACLGPPRRGPVRRVPDGDHARLPARPSGMDRRHDGGARRGRGAPLVARRSRSRRRGGSRSSVSQHVAFDTAIVSSFSLSLTFVRATPIRQVLILVLIEAAFRYGIRGGLGFVVANVPDADRLRVAAQRLLPRALPLREHHAPGRRRGDDRADRRLARPAAARRDGGRERAGAARRSSSATSSDAAPICSTRRTAAPARSARRSTLDEAFGAFIRELRGLIPFDRTAIILSEEGHVRVMATAGHMHDEVLRPGEALPPGALVERVMQHRRDRLPPRHERPPAPGGGDADRASACARAIAAPLLLGAAADRDARDPARASRTRSAPTRSSSPRLLGRLRRDRRPEHPRRTRPSARRSRSCGGSPRCAPTSSRSSRTSCAARWRP